MGAKVPGTKVRMDKVEMNFHYTDYFGSAPKYRLRDTDLRLHGDATLFQRADNTEAGWRVVEFSMSGAVKHPSSQTMQQAPGT